MTEKSNLEVKELLEMGMTPSEILKTVSEEEITQNKAKAIPRQLATKDLNAQTLNPQSKMNKPAIK